MQSLRAFEGKQLVSYLRGGDYAHAGNTESIDLVMERFKKSSDNQIIDVGCGLGGTAHYLQKNNWGQLTGIDLEKKSIDYAKENYKGVEFYQTDVVDLPLTFKKQKFDIICLFNAFYAFNKPIQALHSLHKISHSQSRIAIFDYSDLTNGNNPLYRESQENIPAFKPINLSNTFEELSKIGWSTIDMIDISEKYLAWYEQLISKLHANSNYILEHFGQQAFDKSLSTYSNLVVYLEKRQLGGVIIYAERGRGN